MMWKILWDTYVPAVVKAIKSRHIDYRFTMEQAQKKIPDEKVYF